MELIKVMLLTTYLWALLDIVLIVLFNFSRLTAFIHSFIPAGSFPYGNIKHMPWIFKATYLAFSVLFSPFQRRKHAGTSTGLYMYYKYTQVAVW